MASEDDTELLCGGGGVEERLGPPRSARRSSRRLANGASSGDAWTTVWMKAHSTPGRYDVQLKPSTSWEFKAAFPAPADEGLRYSRSEIVKVKVRG